MKKLLMALSIVVLFTSCADSKTIDGVTYRPYGLINEESCKNDSIHYEVSGWAIASGIIFFEVVAPPIYVFGYNLFEPVCKKSDLNSDNKIKGAVGIDSERAAEEYHYQTK